MFAGESLRTLAVGLGDSTLSNVAVTSGVFTVGSSIPSPARCSESALGWTLGCCCGEGFRKTWFGSGDAVLDDEDDDMDKESVKLVDFRMGESSRVGPVRETIGLVTSTILGRSTGIVGGSDSFW
jgi:hypothetical protein